MGLLGSSVGSLRDIGSLWGAPWGPLWRSRGVLGAVLECLGQPWRLSWGAMGRPKGAQWRLGGALGALFAVLKNIEKPLVFIVFSATGDQQGHLGDVRARTGCVRARKGVYRARMGNV